MVKAKMKKKIKCQEIKQSTEQYLENTQMLEPSDSDFEITMSITLKICGKKYIV